MSNNGNTNEQGVAPLKNETKFLDVLKESITLDQVRMPVLTRLKKRFKHLEELSRAKITKIPMGIGMFNHFETIPPKIFMSGLQAKFDGRVGAITYATYKVEKNPKTKQLKKVIDKQFMDVPGIGKIAHNGSYIIDKVFFETIEMGKAIKRQSYNPSDVGM